MHLEELSNVGQLFAEYAWCVDTGDFTFFDDIFTEDVNYAIVGPGGAALGPIIGRAALREFLVGRAELRTDERRHAITNVRLTADGAGATALLTVLSVRGGTLELRNTGIYRVILDRNGAELRFASMHLSVDVPA